MQKPHPGSLKKAGRAARQRAQERSGSGRITIDAWFPEIEAFVQRGWRQVWIAEAVDLSHRRVSEIIKAGREHRLELLEAPVHVDVSDDVAACLAFTPDGFRRFYERYSGRRLPDHCREWVELFIAHRNLLINVPPRHMKSTIFSVWIPMWLLAINRNEQILIISKTRGLAIKFCRELEYHLSTNKQLVHDLGRFAPATLGDVPWRPAMGELLIEGRSRETKSGDLSIQSRGMEQQILGMEATVVVVDDPTDSAVARSKTAHAEEMRKLHEEILSRVEPKMVGGAAGRAVVVGQRVDPGDLFGELIDQVWIRGPHKGEPLWYVHRQQAVLDWDNQVTLWPEKFDWEEIMLTYERVGGEQAFNTMYQQDPSPIGSGTIRPEWLVAARDEDRILGVGKRSKNFPVARVVSIDPSPTEWNAMIVADTLKLHGAWITWIVDVKAWKGKGAEFKEHVKEALGDYDPDYVIVEESSFFKWFSSEPWYETLRRSVKLIKHHTGVNKLDQELGADSLAGDFELGRIRTPYGDAAARAATDGLEREALAWPLGRQYDRLMALWFIKWNRAKLRPTLPVQNTFIGTAVKPNRAWRVETERREKERRRLRVGPPDLVEAVSG